MNIALNSVLTPTITDIMVLWGEGAADSDQKRSVTSHKYVCFFLKIPIPY